jgi:hypothetical protein
MFKDICFLLIAGLTVYDAMTGRVFLRIGYATRRKQPISFWIWTPVMICIAAFLVTLALYDLYHRMSASTVQ